LLLQYGGGLAMTLLVPGGRKRPRGTAWVRTEAWNRDEPWVR
jgi:hypothetical protein